MATVPMRHQQEQNKTPKVKDPSLSGTVLDRWGNRGSAVPLSMTGHPFCSTWAVGRQDGTVDILVATTNSNYHLKNDNKNSNMDNRHRLRLPGEDDDTPVRGLAYTPDGNLLIAGNDHGMVAIWDVSRKTVSLVHHVLSAHSSWILCVTALQQDSRRFLTCGADRKIHVWKLDQMHQPCHTFETDDDTAWTTTVGTSNATTRTASKSGGISADCLVEDRLVSGTQMGFLQIYSMNE